MTASRPSGRVRSNLCQEVWQLMSDSEVGPKKQSRQPWEQREDEHAKFYSLFLAFRSIGVTRTVRKVAEQAGLDERKVSRVAARFAWSFRADQYDAWVMRHRSKAAEQRLLREIKVESATISDLTQTARILARRALKAVRRDKDKELTPQGAAVLADIVVKLSRLQRGEVTSRRETVAKDARARIGEKLERMAKILDTKFAAPVSDAKPAEAKTEGAVH